MSRAPLPDSATGDTPMPSSFDEDLEFWDEGFFRKLGRKLKQEPLVPFGLALTCYALYGAARSMRRGDKEQTNRFFRARVYAQSFTLLCVCAGALYWKEDREKRKHYKGLLSEKRAQEKREAWIKELEAREEEAELERQKRADLKKAAKSSPAVAAAAQKTEKKPAMEKNTNASPLEDTQLRELAIGSQILSRAMWLWKRHDSGSNNGD